MTVRKSSMWVWGLVLLLVILHQDNWLWNNDTLVFGFIPIGLAYHACISIAASITWFLAIKFAWPSELEHIEEIAAPASVSNGNTGGASE